MMLDVINRNDFYDRGIWFMNGGYKTLASYPGNVVDPAHIKWLETLPFHKVLDLDVFGKVLVTHAPVNPVLGLMNSINAINGYSVRSRRFDESVLWNRGSPRRIPDYQLQLFGHNSYKSAKILQDGAGIFAIGLDTSKASKLTGIHLPSMEIFEQEFID
jgi:hypothetical protein